MLFSEIENATVFLLNFQGKDFKDLENLISKHIEIIKDSGCADFQICWLFQTFDDFTRFNDRKCYETGSLLNSHPSFWVLSSKKIDNHPLRSMGELFNIYNNSSIYNIDYSRLSYFLFYNLIKFMNNIDLFDNQNPTSIIEFSEDGNNNTINISVNLVNEVDFNSFLGKYKKQLIDLNSNYSPSEDEIRVRLFKQNAPFFSQRESSDMNPICVLKFIEKIDRITIKPFSENERISNNNANTESKDIIVLLRNFKREFFNHLQEQYAFIERDEGVLISNSVSVDDDAFGNEMVFPDNADGVKEQIKRKIKEYHTNLNSRPPIAIQAIHQLEYLRTFSEEVFQKSKDLIEIQLKRIPTVKNTLTAIGMLLGVLLLSFLFFVWQSLFIFTIYFIINFTGIIIILSLFTHNYIRKKTSAKVKAILKEMTKALEPVLSELAHNIDDNDRNEHNERAAIHNNILLLEKKLQDRNNNQEENRFHTNEIESLLNMSDIKAITPSSDEIISENSKSSFVLFQTLIINE